MEKNVNFNESANNVVTNANESAKVFAAGLPEGQTKSDKSGGDSETANDLEKTKTVQRSGLIYAEREFSSEYKKITAEFFTAALFGTSEKREEIIAKVDELRKAKTQELVNNKEEKAAQMFTRCYDEVIAEAATGKALTAELFRQHREAIKEAAKQKRLAKEAEEKAAKIEAAAKQLGITVEAAQAMFAAGVLKI